MKLLNRMTGLAVVIVIFAATIATAQEPTAGVVRISDQATAGSQMKLQSYAVQEELGCTDEVSGCESCDQCNDCNSCGYRVLLANLCGLHRYRGDCPRCQQQHSHPDCPHCKNGNCPYHHGKNCQSCRKFGYFKPAQAPPFGCYKMAYPVNPQYFDGRDGSLYSAQGYGVNVSVPLAPNVGAAYNYGWGIPSSRLTPVANNLPAPAMPGIVRFPQTKVIPLR